MQKEKDDISIEALKEAAEKLVREAFPTAKTASSLSVILRRNNSLSLQFKCYLVLENEEKKVLEYFANNAWKLLENIKDDLLVIKPEVSNVTL